MNEPNQNCQIEHHPHHHDGQGEARNKALKRLKAALLLALGLVVIEIAGSLYSQSLSLLADAAHVASDALGLAIGLLAAYLARRPKSPHRSYGYYRIEVLAGLVNSLLLILSSVLLLRSAYHRWNTPHDVDSISMMSVAFFGLIINLVMLLFIRPSHDHNLNMKGVYLHILGDTLSSVLVILAGYFLWLTGYNWIDTIGSVFVAFWIGALALKLMLDSAHVLLEGTPPHIDPEEMEAFIRKSFPQISEIHDFHVWEITADLFAMTAHVEAKVKSLDESKKLCEELSELVQKNYHIGHTTFQVEAR